MKHYSKEDVKQIESRFKKWIKRIHRWNKIKNRLFDISYLKNPRIKKIIIYPGIDDIEILSDLVNRILWWLPYTGNFEVFVLTNKPLSTTKINSLSTPKHQRSYLDNRSDHIHLVSSIKKIDLTPNSRILLHDINEINDLFILRNADKVSFIDPNYRYKYCETTNWSNVFLKTFKKREIEKFEDISKRNFQSLINEKRDVNEAYCFAPGPSFDKYKNLQFKNSSLKIICNSIVFNDEFNDFVQGPDIICFMDALLFYSSSEYTAQFYEKLFEVLDKYDVKLITKLRRLPLLFTHFPELKKHTIGINNKFPVHNLPTPNAPFVKKGKSNVLRTLMIPIASTLTNDIHIIGADGYKSSQKEGGKSWSYGKTIKKESLKDTINNIHPSKFRYRDVDQYYQLHCEALEDMLTHGEYLGKNYKSITKSYIPALQTRSDFEEIIND